MGLFGGSKSTSTSTTNVTDRRIGAAEGAIVTAEGSTTIINAVDAGAIATAQKAAEANARVAERAIVESFALGRQSLEFADNTVENALDFSGDTVERSLDSVDQTLDKSLDTIESINKKAFESSERANNSIADVSGQAISIIERATRSDQTTTLEALIKYGALTVAAIFISKAVRVG